MKRLIPVVLITFFIALIITLSPSDLITGESAKVAELKQPTGRILQYGVYELVRGGKLVDSSVTSTGKAISKPTIQQVEQTHRIPVQKDVYFSYQYRLSNMPANSPVVKLKRILKHPEITLPDGTTSTGSEYFIKGKVKRGEVFAFDGYAFNEDYEMVEGEWVFQIWLEDQKLVEQKFTSYKPGVENVKS